MQRHEPPNQACYTNFLTLTLYLLSLLPSLPLGHNSCIPIFYDYTDWYTNAIVYFKWLFVYFILMHAFNFIIVYAKMCQRYK